jgi:hypothetical protein
MPIRDSTPTYFYTRSQMTQVLRRLRMHCSKLNHHLFIRNIVQSPFCHCENLKTIIIIFSNFTFTFATVFTFLQKCVKLLKMSFSILSCSGKLLFLNLVMRSYFWPSKNSLKVGGLLDNLISHSRTYALTKT